MGKNLKRTTILINPLLWKEFRMKALEEGKSASALLEELIKEKLRKK